MCTASDARHLSKCVNREIDLGANAIRTYWASRDEVGADLVGSAMARMAKRMSQRHGRRSARSTSSSLANSPRSACANPSSTPGR